MKNINAIVIYTLGLIIFGIIYKSSPHLNINKYIMMSVIFILCINMYFSYHSEIKDHKTEISIYEYVERNAATIVTISLALSIYIATTNKANKYVMNNLIFGFLMALMPLILVWMPTDTGVGIRVLRDIKTNFLIIGIGFVANVMIELLKTNN